MPATYHKINRDLPPENTMQFQYDKMGTAGWITLSNPPYNSLIHPVFTDRKKLLDFLGDPELKYIILRGEGKHFCRGAEIENLAELKHDTQALQKAIEQGKELLGIISRATVPVAALIYGSCLGGGLELALSCHFRFAAQNAMFGFPESNHGLMPGMGGTLIDHEQIDSRYLIDLILSGRLFRAEEAQKIGLIDTIAPAKNIEEKLVHYLDNLTCRHTPKLIRSVMQSINNGKYLPMREALSEETQLFCQLARTAINSTPSIEK